MSTEPGAHLDIANLNTIGLLTVPTAIATNAAQSAFVQPFIDKYGYLVNGVRTGGNVVGFGALLNDADNFGRRNGQAQYNYTLGTTYSHDLHFGVQHFKDSEDRFQISNGWGLIQVPALSVKAIVWLVLTM